MRFPSIDSRVSGSVIHAVTLLVALCGCGRIGYDPILPVADADAPDSISGLGPFGPPTLVTEVSDPTAGDDDPTLTGDLLEMYLNSTRAGGPGGGDIWVSTRASTTDRWGTPTLVAELSSPDRETGPEISGDGLTIFFASDRAGGQGSTDVWMSTRASRTDPWTPPVVVAELSSPAQDTSPTPSWSGLAMVLESTRVGGPGSADLYLSTRRDPTSSWSAPVLLPGASTAEHEGSAHFSADELTLIFNGTRGAAEADIHIATRTSTTDPFGPSTAIDELSSPDNEQDPWLSRDGRQLYFVSTRSGDTEIYVASR